MGLHPSQIITGYEEATKLAVEFLEKNIFHEVKPVDLANIDEVTKCLRSSVTSKLPNVGEFFASKIAEACIQILPENPKNFDIELLRTAKLLGASTTDSFVMRGLIVTRNVETPALTSVDSPKIAVFGCPLDTQAAETKGTVLIKNAEDLVSYNRSEEELAHKFVKGIADAGVSCVFSGGTISDIVLHFLEKYKIMTTKVTSKFELRRICKAIGATAVTRLGAPIADEIGTADKVFVKEIGSQKVVVIQRDNKDCKLATIVLRGSTNNILDDIERAIDDGVSAYRNLCRDQRYVAGAGGAEIQLARELEKLGSNITTLDQYAFKQYAKAFEIFPRILCENAGLNADNMLAKMYSSMANNIVPSLDIEEGTVKSAKDYGILDHLQTKIWAIKLASDAAITVLRVDQIIIAKPAGGPKPKQNTNWDED
jgi:T-complex protein 1 subunit theta